MLKTRRKWGNIEHSTLENTRKFRARKFLAEKTRILRGFTKWLIIWCLCSFCQNLAFFRFQKSTPFENLALTFKNLACLKLSETSQKIRKTSWKNRKKLHKAPLFVQKSTLGRLFFPFITPSQRSKTPIVHSRMLPNLELFAEGKMEKFWTLGSV